MRILAGDIGGTKTILQVCDYAGGQFTELVEQRFESQAFDSFDEVLETFLKGCSEAGTVIDAVCIGVAGPVENRVAQVTNLPWRIESSLVSQRFAIPCVYLINDFQAVGYGIERVAKTDLITLQEGHAKPHAVRAVIGAGTGLGQATLIWDNAIATYRVYASEAGHSSFAPTSEEQVELLQYLRKQIECVSLEQVLSGPGIANIFEYLRNKNPSLLTPELNAALQQGDVTPAVVEYALQNRDPLAVKTLDIFVQVYGAAAGNLALTSLPMGGIYIAGGIAPRMVERLQQGDFMRLFTHKSKMTSLLQSIPVNIVTNTSVGLLGAANYATKGELLTAY